MKVSWRELMTKGFVQRKGKKTMSSSHFEEVLKLFESHGWKLQKIYEPYRVFVKQGELPWLIPVHDKKVDAEYVKKFKEFLEERGEI
jgi:hypothetical protein